MLHVLGNIQSNKLFGFPYINTLSNIKCICGTVSKYIFEYMKSSLILSFQ